MSETARVRAIYDRQASRYDQMIAAVDRVLLGDARAWAAGQARGRVLDVAAGTGRNLPHYPATTAVTIIDVSSGMLEHAHRRAEGRLPLVDARLGDAQELPFADGSFDTVVATLALCSIPDDAAAVREMARVLKPGGGLFLVEHVGSPLPWLRRLQRLLEPVSIRVAGDHLTRDPLALITEAGLRVDVVHGSRLGLMLRLAAHKEPDESIQPSSTVAAVPGADAPGLPSSHA